MPIVMPHDYDPACPLLKTNKGCYCCCSKCNYDTHVCPGCGDSLSHLGKEIHVAGFNGNEAILSYSKHEDCTA